VHIVEIDKLGQSCLHVQRTAHNVSKNGSVKCSIIIDSLDWMLGCVWVDVHFVYMYICVIHDIHLQMSVQLQFTYSLQCRSWDGREPGVWEGGDGRGGGGGGGVLAQLRRSKG
jgi:hypothetical protein